MGLFANKVEKALHKSKKKQLPLEVRYQDGNRAHPSQIVRVDTDKFLIEGFAETLREDSLEVTIAPLGQRFVTRVTHKTHDIRGKLLYYCTLPEKIQPIGERIERFFVYPRAVAALSDSSFEEILTEDGAVKTLKMYVWDITSQGLDLVNSRGHGMPVGQRYASCKLSVGKVEAMVSLEVRGAAVKAYGKETLKIVHCRFVSELENRDELMRICRKIDSM